MDFYMASSESCFMVNWIIFQNRLFEVGLTQHREIMALWNLTTINLFYFIMCEDTAWIEFIEIAFGWGHGHIRLQTTLEGPWPHYLILEVSGTTFRHSTWALIILWSWWLLACEWSYYQNVGTLKFLSQFPLFFSNDLQWPSQSCQYKKG
jgi:hypothetical protein